MAKAKPKRYRVIRAFRRNETKDDFQRGDVAEFEPEYIEYANLLDEVDKEGNPKPKELRRPKIEPYQEPVAKQPEPSGDE